ncbi:hypothetical protein [Bacterioplanoides pacificum]|uniref:Uncharacterized protein n=1 Tax=Bacterioplanoides pacificum TaxID=1171596 RepID=A0ABV7VZ02_9GAMM
MNKIKSPQIVKEERRCVKCYICAMVLRFLQQNLSGTSTLFFSRRAEGPSMALPPACQALGATSCCCFEKQY